MATTLINAQQKVNSKVNNGKISSVPLDDVPCSYQLVLKIEAGEYIDMTKLLPD